MNKPQANPLPGLVQNFFVKHLITQRHLSPCTVASYRDSFRLLVDYQETRPHRTAARQCLEDWDAPHILSFLDHLEKKRDCSPRTRNARLAAIHSFIPHSASCESAILIFYRRLARQIWWWWWSAKELIYW